MDGTQEIELSHLSLVPEALNSYLSSTRLSMEQIAKKWNISGAMLSQIKNGKKRAGVDLGLKILRESGACIESRRNWLEERYLESSEEISLVQSEMKRKKIEKSLSEDFCRQLENDPILLDIFLDVALAEESGVTWNSIFKNYGEHGVSLVSSLMEGKIIIFDNSRYYINNENITFLTSSETSFGIVKALIEKQQTNKKRGIFKGELQYDVTDVSKEAYEEIISLNKKYVKQMRTIIEGNEMHRLSGGVRIVTQSLVALTKGALCLIFSLGIMNVSHATGGVRGGSGDKAAGGIRGGDSERVINEINPQTFIQRTPRDFMMRFGQRYTWRLVNYNSDKYFAEKQDAIDYAVELNKSLASGEITKHTYRRLTFGLDRECKNASFLNREMGEAIKKEGVKATVFSLNEKYTPEGRQVYSFSAKYYMPCKKEDKDN